MFTIFISLRSDRRKIFWLRLAALAAGLGFASKYPGGLLLLPVLLTNVYLRKKGFSARRGEYINIIFIFCGTFFAASPGNLLEPNAFLGSMRIIMSQYWCGLNDCFTVGGGWEHAFLSIAYFALAVFSKYWPISLFFFCLMLLGVYSLLRQDRWLAAIFLSLPVFYLPYMWLHNEMRVRNYLIIIPFMAVLVARGISCAINLLTQKVYRTVFIGLVSVLLLVNFAWLFTAAQSIVRRKKIDSGQIKQTDLAYLHGGYEMAAWEKKVLNTENGKDIVRYIRRRKGTSFYLSDAIKRIIPSATLAGLADVTGDFAAADEYIFMSAYEFSLRPEVKKWFFANRFNRYKVISGPYEVNINYYPIWAGDTRAISILTKKLKGVDLAESSGG